MQPTKINFKFFYDDATISSFDNKVVLYIAYVGKYNGIFIFKFGLSRKMFSRDYEQHRKSFDSFKVLFISECDNCEMVESLFKQELKVRNLDTKMTINSKHQTELFTITTKFTHEYIISMMQKLINDNKLPAIKEAVTKISTLNDVVDTYKQTDEIRKLELQFHLSDNYKLQLEKEKLLIERDTKIKQMELDAQTAYKNIDMDTQIALKNIEVDIQREKTKQLAIEKGYDIDIYNDNKPTPPKRTKKEIVAL